MCAAGHEVTACDACEIEQCSPVLARSLYSVNYSFCTTSYLMLTSFMSKSFLSFDLYLSRHWIDKERHNLELEKFFLCDWIFSIGSIEFGPVSDNRLTLFVFSCYRAQSSLRQLDYYYFCFYVSVLLIIRHACSSSSIFLIGTFGATYNF